VSKALKRLTALLFALATLPLLSGCALIQDVLHLGIPKGHYIFFEKSTQETVTVLEGRYGPVIDYPGYRAYPEKRALWVLPIFPEHERIAQDSSFLAILGEGISLMIDGQPRGAVGALTGIYKTPVKVRDLEILELRRDGSLRLRFEDQEFTLRPGQEHQLSYSHEIKRIKWFDNDPLIEETRVTILRNFGLWEKRKIKIGGYPPEY